jgi:hypothetical protein
MPTTYKTLGQLTSTATTESTIYTVPSSTQTVISAITIANLNAGNATYRIRIKINNEANNDKQFIFYDTVLSPKETNVTNAGITLGAGDVVTIYSSHSLVTFNLYGSEIS